MVTNTGMIKAGTTTIRVKQVKSRTMLEEARKTITQIHNFTLMQISKRIITRIGVGSRITMEVKVPMQDKDNTEAIIIIKIHIRTISNSRM